MNDPHHPPAQPSSPQPPPAPAGPGSTPPVPLEDASSQALAEALRSSFAIVKVIMVGLVLLFLGSGIFVVKPGEVAVLLRFGKPVGTGAERLLEPGWHWAWPYPIDQPVRIRVGESHTVTSTAGWHATTPELEAQNQDPPPRGFLSPEADGYTLTADGNIMHARATIKYRISDPIQYTFDFANGNEILTNVVNNALFYAAARVTADDALYKNKAAYRDLVLERVRQKVETLQLGIALEPSDVETKAPVDVREAFEQVNAAEQEKSKVMSDARGYRDEVTRKAVGEAQAILSSGLVSSNRIVSDLAAFASYFQDQLPYYRRDPRLFENRLL
ncbi:MAG: protease modulator HflK, partial [Verrucomicrobia bacterium]|nr:protease modulator HflK [Verrucomicrobiota bacterium]